MYSAYTLSSVIKSIYEFDIQELADQYIYIYVDHEDKEDTIVSEPFMLTV